MVYQDRFIAVVKVNGKILREINNVVRLPFGSDYTILLKNLESNRACINISIDGKDVLDGRSLILNPNSEEELKGFLEGLNVKNQFRFIQKTQQIIDHRGDNIDDGIIRIEFSYEIPSYTVCNNTSNNFKIDYYRSFSNSGDGSYIPKPGSSGDICLDSLGQPQVYSCSTSPVLRENNISQDEGITVKGRETSQNFKTTSIGNLGPSKVIVIRLKGETSNNNIVEKPIYVSDKIRCSSCGSSCKTNMKYCPNCGTYLM